jgi:hypothetical protein
VRRTVDVAVVAGIVVMGHGEIVVAGLVVAVDNTVVVDTEVVVVNMKVVVVNMPVAAAAAVASNGESAVVAAVVSVADVPNLLATCFQVALKSVASWLHPMHPKLPISGAMNVVSSNRAIMESV